MESVFLRHIWLDTPKRKYFIFKYGAFIRSHYWKRYVQYCIYMHPVNNVKKGSVLWKCNRCKWIRLYSTARLISSPNSDTSLSLNVLKSIPNIFKTYLIGTAIACFEAFIIINIITGNKPLRLKLLLKSYCGNLLYGWVCFRHAIGQFAVRNLPYGPKFLKKMLISEV